MRNIQTGIARFIRGMARALDLGNTLATRYDSENSALADYETLQEDWEQVGVDLCLAMGSLDVE